MKVAVSLCIIVKNEPLLEECLKSVRDYVKEIVIVDTGSTDEVTQNIAKKYADIFEVYTECNNPQTGLIENFSLARQYSFQLATQPWIMWCDADDIIIGIENLNKLIIESEKTKNNFEAVAYLFPYEYSYNAEGQCTCQHYRERLFSNKNYFHWLNPVHEVVVPNDNKNIAMITSEELVFKHRRQYSSKVPEQGRNLRILKKYFEKVGESDPRQMYYLGLEYCNSGFIKESIQYLTRYIELSGWEDERVMACLKLVDIYQGLNQLEEGIKWGFKAIEIKENWGEGYFALSRMFYFLALKGGPNELRNWERCIHFAQIGLKLPPTKTLLFVNPLDRECEIHKYLNLAFNKLGNVKAALASCLVGMQKQPNEPNFVNNKKLYEDFLSRQTIIEGVNMLKNNGAIDQHAVEMVSAIINNQPINVGSITTNTLSENVAKDKFPLAITTTKECDWHIPNVWDYDSMPLKMSNEQLQAVVIMIWKQYMLHDEVLSAMSFLENAPYNVRHSFDTQKALKLTRACLEWMDNKEDFQKVNAPTFPEVEAGNSLPNKLIMAEGHRFDLIVNHLKPNSILVDFGSMDGCFTNRYGMLGHKPTGLDVCESSVKLANKKAIEFNTGAKHIATYFQDAVNKIPLNYFEYATSSDTYEHLKDPVNDMLLPAKKMLKFDGKFLLVTPHGAWMRGEYKEWAHPWLWQKEGKSWLQPFPRAHLIAPTVWSVAEHFRKAGYWVKDSYVSYCSPQDAAYQGNIFAEAHLQAPPNYGKGLDIVFFIGNGVEEWTPETVKTHGIGGSETMAIAQAKNLAALGHKVRVYSGCGLYGDGIYDGVEYHQTEKYQDLKCDVLIVSRQTNMLADKYNISTKIKLLWVHDIFAINATNELLLKADRIICLSEWHKQFLISHHNLHPDHIIVTHNAIDFSRFEK